MPDFIDIPVNSEVFHTIIEAATSPVSAETIVKNVRKKVALSPYLIRLKLSEMIGLGYIEIIDGKLRAKR